MGNLPEQGKELAAYHIKPKKNHTQKGYSQKLTEMVPAGDVALGA